MTCNEGLEIKIITNEVTDKECLLPLLKQLKTMGDIGASRNIKIEDWNREEDWGVNKFGMDGDGSHGISKILVNDKEMKKSKVVFFKRDK